MARVIFHVAICVLGFALVLNRTFDLMTWQIVPMAVLALTVARIGPVAVSMVGPSRPGRPCSTWGGSVPEDW